MTKTSYLGDIYYGGKRMQWGKGAAADGTVYLSGVEGSDPKTGDFPKDVKAQTKLALEKIAQRLADAGSDVSHIVKVVSYIVGRENVDGFRAARQEWSSANTPGVQVPTYASTLVVVVGLARPEMLVEIDVTAVSK